MVTLAYVFAAAVFVALLYFGIRYFVSARKKFGGGQVIVCPETGAGAMVEVDADHAALTSLIGKPDIRLESCSRWPLNRECGQECLIQLAVAPPECLVRGVLMQWYKGKRCAFCLRVFDEQHLIAHKPALLNAEGITREWGEISLPDLMMTLDNDQPVCWNCHIAQTFRREHPDLVVDRSFQNTTIPKPGHPDETSPWHASHRDTRNVTSVN